MTFIIRKVFSPDKGYSCVFRQWKAKSHCQFLHGYDLRFAVEFACEEANLTSEGWVVDFGGFKELDEILKTHFDHRLVIAYDDPMAETLRHFCEVYGCAQVTTNIEKVGCEAFAVWFAVECSLWLDRVGRANVVRIRRTECWEHGANAAFFEPSIVLP